ncbi:hypothetical protein D3C72_1059750 [compost metagenome]
MNSTANHGTRTWRQHAPRLAAPGVDAATRNDRPMRNGASIITRSIFSTTAALAAPGLTASPTATTCATSWMVEPAKRPKACSVRPRYG